MSIHTMSKNNMKSSYTLWGPKIINGEKRWGVNEKRDCGTYTKGSHNGFWTRKEAEESLKQYRAEERSNREVTA